MSDKKTPDCIIRSVNKYQKRVMKSYLVKVNKNTEGEIIEKLEGVPSKQGYIKDLIRKDIKSENRKKAKEEKKNERNDENGGT